MQIKGGFPLKGEVDVSPSSQESLFSLGSGLIFNESLILDKLSLCGLVTQSLEMYREFGVCIVRNDDGLSVSNIKDSSSVLFLKHSYLWQPLFFALPGLLRTHGFLSVRSSRPKLFLSAAVKEALELFFEFGLKIQADDDFLNLTKADHPFENKIITLSQKSSFLTALALLMTAAFVEKEIVFTNVKLDIEILRFLDMLKKFGFDYRINQEDGVLFLNKELKEIPVVRHSIGFDPYDLGIFSLSGLLSNGSVICKKVVSKEILPFLSILEKIGLVFESSDSSLTIWSENTDNYSLSKTFSLTSPYFSWVWDPLICLALSRLCQNCLLATPYTHLSSLWIRDFRHLGIKIELVEISEEKMYRISGKNSLSGKSLNLPFSPLSSCLFLVCLLASGKSDLSSDSALDFFHENLVQRFINLGAQISFN